MRADHGTAIRGFSARSNHVSYYSWLMPSRDDARLELVESLKNLLVSRAIGGIVEDSDYQQLRRQAINDPIIESRLPRFVRTSRDIFQYWGFIQGKYPSYRERRQYIAEAFEPLIALLEGTAGAPSDPSSDTLAAFDSIHVRTAWQRAIERRDADPEGAITAARTLVETVCKHILDEAGISYPDDADLPKLHHLVSSAMNLAPSQQTADALRRMMGGIQSVVEGLAALRNRLGDAHGKATDAVLPSSALSAFAVNLAGGTALFLVESWEAHRQRTAS